MSITNQETLMRFIDDVWNNGRLDTIASYLAPEYTIHHDPGDPWEHQTLSVEGFRDRVRESRASAPDQTFDVQSIISDDDKVSITWLWTGTHSGEISGFPPTGQTLTMSGATTYFFSDGLLTGHWQIADRLTIYQQLMATGQPG